MSLSSSAVIASASLSEFVVFVGSGVIFFGGVTVSGIFVLVVVGFSTSGSFSRITSLLTVGTSGGVTIGFDGFQKHATSKKGSEMRMSFFIGFYYIF